MKKIFSLLLTVALLGVAMIACSHESQARYDYDLSKYVEFGDYMGVRAAFDPPGVCSEEEIDDVVFQVLLTKAQFTPTDEPAALYDKVKIDVSMFMDGKYLEDLSQTGLDLILGLETNGDLLRALARVLEGAAAGDIRETEYTFPEGDSSLGSWAGQTVSVQGKVLGVYEPKIPECTDEFVMGLGDYGFGTVEEFRNAVKEDILSTKENNKNQAVFDAFMETVKVKKYPEKEIEQYIEKYKNDINTVAQSYEMSYEEYVTGYLGYTLEQIETMAREDAESRVKVDMVCIQVSRLLGTTLSEEEYRAGLEKYYQSEMTEFASVEEFEAYYTREIIWESVRWDKSLQVILENAVRIEE